MEHVAHQGSAAAAPWPVLVLVAILLAYLLAARRLRRAKARWGGGRIAAFAIGVALLAAPSLPPLLALVHGTPRGHVAQHVIVGMLAPIGLVLGAPGTLLLRTLPVRSARRVVAVLGSRPVRGLSHPATAALLNVGALYLLYLTPLYALTLDDPRLQGLVHLHFVLAGYLFTWSIVGPDPAPHRPGLPTRLAVLFVASAAHAILAKLMYASGFPRGTPFDLAELRAAAQWMYYGGDLAELLLATVFFRMWVRRRGFPRRPAPTVPAPTPATPAEPGPPIPGTAVARRSPGW